MNLYHKLKVHNLALFLSINLFISCDTELRKSEPFRGVTNSLSSGVIIYDSLKARKEYKPRDYTTTDPILTFGYRFIITGDFDGDGSKEKLLEHYFSRKTGKEANKYYNDEPDRKLTIDKEPVSFVLSTNKNIDTLHIAENDLFFGLAFMKNEGDLNNDGTDELSYVVEWGDFSNLNTCFVVTFKDKKWQELFRFSIWDWQLPALPRSFFGYKQYGLDTLTTGSLSRLQNEKLISELKQFRGFIKKLGANKVQVRFKNDEAIPDSTIINVNDKDNIYKVLR